ncbi:hypothetical protein OsI_33621 [Oryza sativa Indica Group]|uniref:Uncharacterized protein n=1 Tax=Oryza sativa subsp. indica TaxID=39946 RepID=A2Z7E3_ORYSI|nr:hypothetical protein OsI_33621 [Oryza sativa Indica Group]
MAGAAAAAAKGSRYKLHGKKSKVDNQPQIKEIHDKCGTINTCKTKADTKLHGGKNCIYQEVQNLHCVRFETFILKKFDGTVGVPILRSKRVPPSEEDSDAMES